MESTLTQRLATLSHPSRMAIFRLLMRRYPDAMTAGHILSALDLKPSTASAYLSALTMAGLIGQKRAGTTLYYRIDMGAARKVVSELFDDCCRGRPDLCPPSLAPGETAGAATPDRPLNVLFVCSGNSARSIMAEAILNDLSGARFNAFSAGTRPATAANAEAMQILSDKGHDVSALKPKALSRFQGSGAPEMDFVFTLCDLAANEDCSIWPGQPISAHWGMPDPAIAHGTEAERKLEFQETYGALANRISAFCALPLSTLTRASLQTGLDAIATPKGT